jgi:uncharacterized protein YjiK
MIREIAVVLGLTFAVALPTHADSASPGTFDLSTYQLRDTYSLGLLAFNPLSNKQADEASAVTWNRDTGTLFIIEDEGTKIYEVSVTGAVLGSMNLTGFQDTEGLTWLGGGSFAVAEERLRSLYRLDYVAGSTVARSSLSSINLGATVGNIGVEGVAWDPLAGNFVYVKEKTPTEVNVALNPSFPAGTATPSSLFDPAGLGLLDLADVEVLARMPSLTGTVYQDHLLLLSQESKKLLQVTRGGSVLAMYDLAGLGANGIEGVTVDDAGIIYLVAEPENVNGVSQQARLFTLAPTAPAPVPLPAAAWLLLGGLGTVARFARRRQRSE